MIWFKSCTKCDGDLVQNMDMDGKYVACVQCGRHLDEVEQALMENSTGKKLLTAAVPSSLAQRAS